MYGTLNFLKSVEQASFPALKKRLIPESTFLGYLSIRKMLIIFKHKYSIILLRRNASKNVLKQLTLLYSLFYRHLNMLNIEVLDYSKGIQLQPALYQSNLILNGKD